MKKIFSFILFSFLSMSALAENTIKSGTVFPAPKHIDEFLLTADSGMNFSSKNLMGKWSLFFFGFTNCQMICPTSMSELNKMVSELQKDKIKNLPQVVFISVDPDRDTATKVKQYAISFNKDFIGVTGNRKQLDKLTNDLGVLYMKLDDKKNPQSYNIDHSGSILLINPKGELSAIFTMPHDGLQLAKDFNLITKQQS